MGTCRRQRYFTNMLGRTRACDLLIRIKLRAVDTEGHRETTPRFYWEFGPFEQIGRNTKR
jgi:hypothetical protein